MTEPEHAALEAAARDAMLAPSVFNTQPWTWRIDGTALELRADRARQLPTVDPEGHELLLSCGAALHHARVALAAAGWITEEERFRPGQGEDVLARICIVGRREPSLDALHLQDAIPRRRTDRRPFSDEPVADADLRILTLAAAAEGVLVHRVRLDQMPMLAIAVATAGAIETADPDYRNELIRWTNRPEWSRDGVPAGTAVRKVPRRVPVREFVVAPNDGLPVEAGGDRGAAYLVLHGEGRTPLHWLRAGEALSAVLLTAVSRGLCVAPMTDVLEVEHPRELIISLLEPGQFPYVLVRCGHSKAGTPLGPAPRRDPSDVVEGQTGW
jgi:hypothetical protein